MTCMRAQTSSYFGLIGPLTAELAALERLKKSPLAYNGKKDVSTFSLLFLIGSFIYLQVMITCMRAWMSLKFSQIQPLVSMVTDRVMMGKTVSPLFLGCFHPFLFKLAGNNDMHESSEEFKFRPDWPLTAESAALERLKKIPNIISILKPVFLYRGLGLFDKSSSKTSSPLRTVHRISKIHSKLLSVIHQHFIPGHLRPAGSLLCNYI